MSKFGSVRRATALVPLAVLSAAWTASLAGVGVGTASADSDGSKTLPDGTSLPAAVIEAPASVGDDALTRAAALTPGKASDIPQAALAAYQRAEAVINKADPSCQLPWELIAAIGRVESDHGRFAGNSLDAQGVATPGIYGVALNGKKGTQLIPDTDGGQYDNDTRFDRAVGPMQFIPSTWAVVGVDGDNDGTRNPQDVDDASLATAVYLCSGDDDLSQEQGQRASIYRYNHSNAYVDLVMQIMQAYLDGDFSAVPTSTLTTGVILPDPSTTPSKGGTSSAEPGRSGGKGGKGGEGGKGGGKPTPTSTPTPTSKPTPTQTPTKTPTQEPTQTPTQMPTNTPTGLPTEIPTELPTVIPTIPLPTVVPTVLTVAQATTQCLASGISSLDLAALNACINDLMNP